VPHPSHCPLFDHPKYYLAKSSSYEAHHFVIGVGISEWYSAELRVGWLGGSSLGRGWEFSFHHDFQTCTGAHPASYPMGARDSCGQNGQGVKLTTHLHLVRRSRMHGAVPPLLQYVFMAWCSVKAQGQLCLIHYLLPLCNFLHPPVTFSESEYLIQYTD
jgi:hypothetical protein